MSEKKRPTYFLTRVIVSLILLVFLCLAWYGAETLLYGYSKPSVVDAIVAVWLVALISGNLQREMIIRDRKREFAEGFFNGLAKAKEEAESRDGADSETDNGTDRAD